MSVVFNSDDILASASLDKTVKLWGITNGACIYTSTMEYGVSSVAFSSDRLNAFGTLDGKINIRKIYSDRNEIKITNISKLEHELTKS